MLAQAPLVISRWIFLQDPDSSGNFPHIQEPPVSLPASHLCVRCHSRVIFPSSTVSLLRNKRTPRSENICWPIISVSVVRGKRGGFYYGKFLQYKNLHHSFMLPSDILFLWILCFQVECRPLCHIGWYKNGSYIRTRNSFYTVKTEHLESNIMANLFESVRSTLVFNVEQWPLRALSQLTDNRWGLSDDRDWVTRVLQRVRVSVHLHLLLLPCPGLLLPGGGLRGREELHQLQGRVSAEVRNKNMELFIYLWIQPPVIFCSNQDLDNFPEKLKSFDIAGIFLFPTDMSRWLRAAVWVRFFAQLRRSHRRTSPGTSRYLRQERVAATALIIPGQTQQWGTDSQTLTRSAHSLKDPKFQVDKGWYLIFIDNEGVSRHQDGTYICEASNAHGLSQAKTQEHTSF